MNAVTTANRVRDAIREIAGMDAEGTVSDDQHLKAMLDFDSLDISKLAQMIEIEFGVKATEAEQEKWVTVCDVVMFVASRGK